MATNFLSNRQLALCEFPMLPQRESQRKSSSRTQATRPRTFKELRIWENFNSDARNFAMELTDEPHLSLPKIVHPMIWAHCGLDVATSKIAVQGTLERILLQYVNNLARNIGFHFEYGGAGSGRSSSRTDIVIFDRSVSQNMNDLSERVYGVGEVKGSWQWEIRSTPYAQQFLDDDKKEMLLKVTQQMYGDMVVDEAIVGFISNYNQTIFFYRDDAKSKSLYVSPLVDISDAPIEKFLYVLHRAQSLKIIKRELSRNIVELTPVGGYLLEGVVPDISPGNRRKPKLVVKASKRKRRDVSSSSTHCSKLHTYGEYDVDDIPTYRFDAIGFTGGVVGLGKYGNVFEGVIAGQKVAMKTVDACDKSALWSFICEQTAYNELHVLQGVCIPCLLLVGRLPHTSMIYLALTCEKGGTNVKELICNNRFGKRCKKAIIDALSKIHGEGVLHGDVTFSNMLWNRGKPYFIDFEYSIVHVSDEESLKEEMGNLRKLLDKASTN